MSRQLILEQRKTPKPYFAVTSPIRLGAAPGAGPVSSCLGGYMRIFIAIVLGALMLPGKFVAAAEERPVIDWSIHTVVSSEIPNRHRIVKRAVLVWGETWPEIIIEIIDWTKGMGGQQLVSAQSISLEGQSPVCPDPAESWCGALGSLYWENDILVHHFQARDARYRCTTRVSNGEIGQTVCSNEL